MTCNIEVNKEMHHMHRNVYAQESRASEFRMSAAAKAWLKRQEIDDRKLMVVLSAVADLADTAGVCRADQKKIAEAVGVNERTVRRALTVVEALGLASRDKRCDREGRGRLSDLITLHMDRQFTITTEAVMAAKKMGATGQNVRLVGVAPTDENDASPYKARAHSVNTQTSTSNPTRSLPCSTRVWPEHDRGKFRARLTVAGLGMDLGRFDDENEALAFADEAMLDVEHSFDHPGTPRHPVINPKIASMTAPELGAFLFGDDAPQEQTAAA
jgi:hypothetical protein